MRLVSASAFHATKLKLFLGRHSVRTIFLKHEALNPQLSLGLLCVLLFKIPRKKSLVKKTLSFHSLPSADKAEHKNRCCSTTLCTIHERKLEFGSSCESTRNNTALAGGSPKVADYGAAYLKIPILCVVCCQRVHCLLSIGSRDTDKHLAIFEIMLPGHLVSLYGRQRGLFWSTAHERRCKGGRGGLLRFG